VVHDDDSVLGGKCLGERETDFSATDNDNPHRCEDFSRMLVWRRPQPQLTIQIAGATSWRGGVRCS
jgi:hypothetical protein